MTFSASLLPSFVHHNVLYASRSALAIFRFAALVCGGTLKK
jgi:hypothetical protein